MGQFRNQFTPARVALAGGLFLAALGWAIFMQVKYPPFGKVHGVVTRAQWNDYWWLFALCVTLVGGTNFLVLRAAKRRQQRLDTVAPEPVTDAADAKLNPLRQTGMHQAITLDGPAGGEGR